MGLAISQEAAVVWLLETYLYEDYLNSRCILLSFVVIDASFMGIIARRLFQHCHLTLHFPYNIVRGFLPAFRLDLTIHLYIDQISVPGVATQPYSAFSNVHFGVCFDLILLSSFITFRPGQTKFQLPWQMRKFWCYSTGTMDTPVHTWRDNGCPFLTNLWLIGLTCFAHSSFPAFSWSLVMLVLFLCHFSYHQFTLCSYAHLSTLFSPSPFVWWDDWAHSRP